MTEPETEIGWKWNVGVVCIAVTIALMGMSLVIPFLPLYLSELHVPQDQLSLWAGWIGGINFLCSAIFAPLWGSLADRFGRKKMALRALMGLAVAVSFMGFCQNAWQLLLLRVVQGIFGGFVAEATALVGTSVPRERMGGALGLVQASVVAGNLMGPLVGGELSHHFGYRQTFLITGGALGVAMLLVLVMVRERFQRSEEERPASVAAGIRELLALPVLRWLLVAALCTHGSLMLINPQITLFVRELVGDGEHLKRMAGLVTSAPALTSFLMAPVWGRAGDRRGHAGVLGVALLATGLLIPWASAVQSVWHLFAIRLVMGGFTSAANPSTHSIAAHSVPDHRTAGAFSLLSSAQMLGACLGPFASGPLATAFGVRSLFPVTGVLLLIASFAAFRVNALRSHPPSLPEG